MSRRWAPWSGGGDHRRNEQVRQGGQGEPAAPPSAPDSGVQWSPSTPDITLNCVDARIAYGPRAVTITWQSTGYVRLDTRTCVTAELREVGESGYGQLVLKFEPGEDSLSVASVRLSVPPDRWATADNIVQLLRADADRFREPVRPEVFATERERFADQVPAEPTPRHAVLPEPIPASSDWLKFEPLAGTFEVGVVLRALAGAPEPVTTHRTPDQGTS